MKDKLTCLIIGHDIFFGERKIDNLFLVFLHSCTCTRCGKTFKSYNDYEKHISTTYTQRFIFGTAVVFSLIVGIINAII